MLIADYFTRIGMLGILAAGSNLLRCNSQQAPPRPQELPEVAVVTVAPEPVALTTELPGRTSPYLVAEVNTGLQQLFHGDLRHVCLPFP